MKPHNNVYNNTHTGRWLEDVYQWIFSYDVMSLCCHGALSISGQRARKSFSGNIPSPSINVVMQFTDAITKTC